MPWWGQDKPKLLEKAEFHMIDDLEISTKELGRGSYGTVYCALYNGRACVVKEMHSFVSNVHKDGPSAMDMCIKEINTLSSLRHPSIVQFLGVYFKQNSSIPILVMERMWKNLFDVLEEQPNELPLLIKTHILYDVACGLQYLHGQKNPGPVVHRDLNANNILLTENLKAKIGDLGQAKALVSIAAVKLSTKPGNTAHMPPEALKHYPTYDVKLDIFSFGCTVIHIITENFPKPDVAFIESNSDLNSFRKLSEVERRKRFIDKMTSSDCYSFQQITCKCLKDSPTDRPTASDICSELETNLQNMEKGSPMLAKQYSEDKLSLVHTIRSQEIELASNKTTTKELQEEKETLKSENQSLHTDLAEQGAVNKELNRQIDQFKGVIEKYQDDIKIANAKFQEFQDEKKNLQIKVEAKEAILSENYNKIANLEENMEKTTDALRAKAQENEGIIAKNSDLTRKVIDLQKQCKVLQSTAKKQRDELSCLRSNQRGKIMTSTGSPLHQLLLELQDVNETEYQQLQNQRQSYVDAFGNAKMKIDKLTAELSDIKKKYATQKQQLEEKSNHVNSLEASFNELQKTLCSKEEKLKITEETNATLRELLENGNTLQKKLDKEKKDQGESLRRKELELQSQEKECADEISTLKTKHSRELEDLQKDCNMHKSQAEMQIKAIELLKVETQCKLDLRNNTEDKLELLQNELKSSTKIQKDHKRQFKQHEKLIKEKDKYIQQLEKSTTLKPSDHFKFDIHWNPHLSLPFKINRPSATLVKDKVFINGGYENVSSQGRDLASVLKTLENGNRLVCFHTENCKYDSIASPVVLGGVTSVNGQCVLVSGAEGNTLTGNVYVLCEEGSDEQWKKFSEPVPTPRILPCVCCYGERWLIVCGGYACKEGSNLLEAVNVVEILDITEGKWYNLPDEKCPNVSKVLSCSVANEELYVIGNATILKSSIDKLIKTTVTKKSESTPIWLSITAKIERSNDKEFHPFSVVDVNGEPMIIASISGSEDDVTCVLMKDTTDTWRKMGEAVECQHCSAVVVTRTLELLLFGGSEKVEKHEATKISQRGTLIPNLIALDHPHHCTSNGCPQVVPIRSQSYVQGAADALDGAVNQPPYLSFTGPIHTKQFDHNGGIFQSPIHKVSIVVPPNAIDDGEKVTVHMGATTSGPFDLPEDCKLRSAVVWLGSDSDVVLKRSIAVVVPHSAVFTSPQHHSMMRFLTCEDCEGPRYKLECCTTDCFKMDKEQGSIELYKLGIIAIAASSDSRQNIDEDAELLNVSTVSHQQESLFIGKILTMPPSRYLAKLFWPYGLLPKCFRADVFYFQNIPTESYKVDKLYRKDYYDENGKYPEMVETEFLIGGNGTDLQCILPCIDSSECDCLSGWRVTQMSDINEIQVEKDKSSYPQYKIDPKKWSFKFTCQQRGADLTCCFAFQGGERIIKSSTNQETIINCLQKRFQHSYDSIPFIVETGVFDKDTGVFDKDTEQNG